MAARAVGVWVLLLSAWTAVPAAQALPETFEVISVNTTGCSSGQFGMTVERANLDGGLYIVRTEVTVGGLVYMNEQASIFTNGLIGWNVLDTFTYYAVSNLGTYPIPSDQQMTLVFTIERPKGTRRYAWRLVVDGCNTGNILFNAPFSDYDVDLDGLASPLTDGLMILRYMFGFRGAVLISGAVGPECTRCDAPSIEAFLVKLF